jgi:LmbE family N-acetylglucosaminyl deacetylase
VTATLDRKLDALRAHPSQIRHPERLEPRIREWAADEGAAIAGTAAEAFRVVVIEEDAIEEQGPTHVTPPQTEGGDPVAG